ncbi:hypothetical protein [Sphingobium chlorophenolicum]|uniref:Uncharacterized protein n=1 Tax=Sphingobium chlorophenolicum TaxID=46429 RepID=A0A081RH15_SPHCR|nr:hypothetical protein [Sphingobium chlorophenolicum]KEQ54488.1 hypothetical protein BV95_01296 [Sphingobium chlorophenolicum]
MDTNTLVKEGQCLVRYLDEGKVKPRGAVWVYSSDTETWRLWIVPSAQITDKSEFYRLVSETISKHRVEMPTLDIGSVELKSADHPVVQGLGKFLHMEGLGAATFSNNRFNGFFLPDGVVLRMAV